MRASYHGFSVLPEIFYLPVLFDPIYHRGQNDPMETLIVLMICGVIFGFIGMAIGDLGDKKNGNTGFALGFLLGPIGCIIAAVIPSSNPTAKASAKPAEDQARKIAALEAQLAKMNAPIKPPVKSHAKPAYDDGDVATYKLD